MMNDEKENRKGSGAKKLKNCSFLLIIQLILFILLKMKKIDGMTAINLYTYLEKMIK